MERGGGPTSYKRLNDYAGMNGEDFINQEGINLFQVGPHFRRGVQASIRKESRTYTPSRAKRPKDFQERQGGSHYEGQGQKNFQSGLSP